MKKINYIWGGAVLLLAVVFFTVFFPKNDLPANIEGRWQAVFLSDGQVYFGKLEKENDRFFKLTNVFYLKYASQLQQDKNKTDYTPSNQNLNLVKLGGEVHGPDDIMFIAKDKILFFENLKDTSTVVNAIKNR